MTYLYVFFGYEQYQWVLIVILNVMAFIGYINYRYSWPYYNDTMNKFFCALTGNFMWANFCLLIAKCLEETEFDGAL